MIKELLPHVFNKPIAFHRILAEVAGSVNGGVFLSQAMYWSNIKTAQDGWFYKTVEDWEGETFLSRREQETVRRNLIKIGVLEEKRAGIPAKLYFRVKTDALLKKLTDIAQTRTCETAVHDTTKQTNTSGGKGASNTETTTETTSETTKVYISAQSEFDEFWAAYPKRPNNPKAPAAAKYRYVREKIKIPHEALLQAAKAYAATREGEDPKFTAQAVTWLNQRRWEEEHEVVNVPAASDADLDAIVSKYPGVVSDRAAATKALAAELANGVTVGEISEAAQKLTLLVKQARSEGREFSVPILETWIKFKWRDMDAYELYRGGMTMKLFVRPKKVK